MARANSSGDVLAPRPELDIDLEVARLAQLSVAQLRARYEELFHETTISRNRTWLMRRIAWRAQADVQGGLSDRALARATELADEAYLRTTPPRVTPAPVTRPASGTVTVQIRGADARLPVVGTELIRPYKGRTLKVRVLPQGFLFDGTVFKSLSAVAKHVTGSHVNGFHFFKLGKEGDA